MEIEKSFLLQRVAIINFEHTITNHGASSNVNETDKNPAAGKQLEAKSTDWENLAFSLDFVGTMTFGEARYSLCQQRQN